MRFKVRAAGAEIIFDLAYLFSGLILAGLLLFGGQGGAARTLAGVMALVLILGDAFHLAPRIALIRTGEEERLQSALGLGKQITSITMTVFYLLLWQIGLVVFAPGGIGAWSAALYILTGARVVLCLLPQNKWRGRYSPIGWAAARNAVFLLQGALVTGLFFINRGAHGGLGLIWLAIILSFAFYLPVVFWAEKRPAVGMLMLPKTCVYIWMLIMCLSL